MYIDTDPSFENITKALEICQSKVKEDGIIAGYNYAKGDWLSKNRYGVTMAVHAFCKECWWELIYLTHECDRCLSYAIRRINTKIAVNKSQSTMVGQ